ncbi:hypothetical protein F511_36754 [Dorcoceras hygrometricum]|uniref:Uncharacterized protein n=1 Tax=Dorcoceras hygrometricum TaxID=472368 RepID=A0A2Z7D8E7_9LAMI|nr:hypothetical protein F511_36754 [Dorcoceras hygrometricum]
MSLFDLQDVCIAIGSIATLDLPMVVDLIGIYGLKGPYCVIRIRRGSPTAESNPDQIPENPAEAEDVSTAAAPEVKVESTDAVETLAVHKEIRGIYCKMAEYDKWAHFRTEVRLNTVTSMTSIAKLAEIEDDFISWAETELVSELMERRMFVLNKLYDMEVNKRVDEHRANFNPAEPSANYDHMCIRFLDRELKSIIMQNRALRLQASLPLLVPESSVSGSTPDDILLITFTVGCITSKQGTTPDQDAAKQPTKEPEQRILAIEHQDHEEEQPAPED